MVFVGRFQLSTVCDSEKLMLQCGRLTPAPPERSRCGCKMRGREGPGAPYAEARVPGRGVTLASARRPQRQRPAPPALPGTAPPAGRAPRRRRPEPAAAAPPAGPGAERGVAPLRGGAGAAAAPAPTPGTNRKRGGRSGRRGRAGCSFPRRLRDRRRSGPASPEPLGKGEDGEAPPAEAALGAAVRSVRVRLGGGRRRAAIRAGPWVSPPDLTFPVLKQLQKPCEGKRPAGRTA